MRKIILFFLSLFLLHNAGTGVSNEQPTIYVENVEIIGIEQTATADIILSEAPDGLAGYNLTISLCNPEVAEIKEIIFPSWATLKANSSLPADSVWIKAVDLNNNIKEDAANIILVTIVLKSEAEGSTCINLAITRLDDDEGYPIPVITQSGILSVTINHPPNEPSSPYPTNGATNVAITTTLSWQCSDIDGDAITYDIYFGITSNPPKMASNITTSSFNPGALQYSTTYYWKVVAWDEHGAKNESDLWHFTTEAYMPPPPNHPPIITITYPNDGGIVSGNITIQGTASDEDGDETIQNEDGDETIQKVEVKIDNGKWVVATGTTSWSYKWNTSQVENGRHTIYARAYDGKDYSNIVSINVNVFNNHKPFIEITEPENGSIVKGSIIIKGMAWDIDGNETLQKVEIRIDEGEWRNATGTINWAYTLDTKKLENGNHTIYARSYDGKNYSNIVSISIEVKNKKGIPGFEVIALLAAVVAAVWAIKRKRRIT